jgi:hypothetical protein
LVDRVAFPFFIGFRHDPPSPAPRVLSAVRGTYAASPLRQQDDAMRSTVLFEALVIIPLTHVNKCCIATKWRLK